MSKHKQAGIVLMVLVLASIFSAFAIAGDLEPLADPAPTMHSLEDIYSLVANIGTAQVEKSGQTTSYATGDDGDMERGIASPAPRFTDNGDGTVTDNLTGMIWLQNANCFGSRTWSVALSDSNGLADGTCGLTDGSIAGDWRLSNVKELQSLIDFGNYSPALPTGHPFTNVQYGFYWSSTTNASITGNAWIVNMADGFVHSYDKARSSAIWPVRGGN